MCQKESKRLAAEGEESILIPPGTPHFMVGWLERLAAGLRIRSAGTETQNGELCPSAHARERWQLSFGFQRLILRLPYNSNETTIYVPPKPTKRKARLDDEAEKPSGKKAKQPENAKLLPSCPSEKSFPIPIWPDGNESNPWPVQFSTTKAPTDWLAGRKERGRNGHVRIVTSSPGVAQHRPQQSVNRTRTSPKLPGNYGNSIAGPESVGWTAGATNGNKRQHGTEGP